MANHDKCPICGMPIKPHERLLSYYHEPKDWWVVVHTGWSDDCSLSLNGGAIEIPNANTICHQARYETPILIGQRGPG